VSQNFLTKTYLREISAQYLYRVLLKLKSCQDQKTTNILKGTTLTIYHFIVKSPKPAGVREIQRELNLSSHSVARYHLIRLEKAGLVKQEQGNYVVKKVSLEHSLKIGRFIVPRFLLYAVLAVAFLLFEFAFLRSAFCVYIAYTFGLIITFLFILIFLMEAFRVWYNARL
jgi:predicted DNA-binding transcriptional regulator